MAQLATVINLAERRMRSSSSSAKKSSRHKARPRRSEGYYLDEQEYENRLDDLRGEIIHSHLTLRELSARTRLAVGTISKFINRETKRPHDYTVQRLRAALGRPHPDEDLKGMSRFLGAWLQDYRRKKRRAAQQRKARRTAAARKRKNKKK